MPRVVLIGTGTGVGKTYVAAALARRLRALGAAPVLALKPIETGVAWPGEAVDARCLEEAAGAPRPPEPHPLYAYAQPVSPHLAARREGRAIDIAAIAHWVATQEATAIGTTLRYDTLFTLLETAGGVFSPVSDRTTNYDLAAALDPAIWVLVAPDSLGVLHDVRATCEAMTARGRRPDHVVLSAARAADASTATNAEELARVGLPRPCAVVRRDHAEDLNPLAALLSANRPARGTSAGDAS